MGSFSLAEYDFVPTDQLLHQFQAWQSGLSQPEQANKDPNLSSGDEIDYAIDLNQDQGGMAEEASEDLDGNHNERVTSPVNYILWASLSTQ